MAEVFPRVGQRVALRFPDLGSKSYDSTVEEIYEDRIALALPREAAQVLPVRRGHRVVVSGNTERALYTFETVVEEVHQKPIFRLLVETPRVVERIQRRRWFRLPVLLPATFRSLGAAGGDLGVMSGEILDISGAGLRLFGRAPLARGDLIQIDFKLGEREFSLKGRVVAIHALGQTTTKGTSASSSRTSPKRSGTLSYRTSSSASGR